MKILLQFLCFIATLQLGEFTDPETVKMAETYLIAFQKRVLPWFQMNDYAVDQLDDICRQIAKSRVKNFPKQGLLVTGTRHVKKMMIPPGVQLPTSPYIAYLDGITTLECEIRNDPNYHASLKQISELSNFHNFFVCINSYIHNYVWEVQTAEYGDTIIKLEKSIFVKGLYPPHKKYTKN